jgi:hypothetical protein
MANPYGHPRCGLVAVFGVNIAAAVNVQATRAGAVSLAGGRGVQLQVAFAVDDAAVSDDIGAHAWFDIAI